MYKVKVAVSKDGRFLRHDWIDVEANNLDEARQKAREIKASTMYAMDLTASPDLRTLRKVCPVCEGGKVECDENYQSKSTITFVGGDRPVLCVVHEDCAGRDHDTTCTTINFCPFCGRKLTKLP
jgi:hypothetical protein